MESDIQPLLEITSDPLIIGEWTFYPDIFKLKKGHQEIKLEPRVACLLNYLAHNPDIPVSREVLIRQVWANMVVGDEVLTSAINKIRNAFGDNSRQPKVIETIPKAGYRLIAKVELPGKATKSDESAPGMVLSPSEVKYWRYIAAGFIFLMLIFTGYYLWKPVPADVGEAVSAISVIPSIAILPFENISQDVNQEYFVDGITEDIITGLSRIRNLHVLARNTSFSFKGQKLDLPNVVLDLKVSHILEGSVRKSGNKLRITARLFDTRNGQTVWAESYDRLLKDVFIVQDDVTQNIVTSLSIQLTSQDREVMEHPTTSNFAAYDLYLQGRKLMSERTFETDLQAQEYYRQATRLDPTFARAYGALAVAMTRVANSGYIEATQEEKERALKFARKAVALNSKSQNVFWSLGFTHLYRREYTEAEQATRNALIIAPHYADGMALLALIKNYLGAADESIELIKRATFLNPHFTWDYLYNLGWAYYSLKQYDRAIDYLQQALERNENARPPRLFLAASFIGQGSQDDAEWEIEQLLTQFPNMSISFIRRETPLVDVEKMNQYISHLRQAGLPEK